eukprot:GFYU01067335.1.p1 GENE.GFYU01067335.1~~GFYU01067335.1.p1  ORF type:complete len:265 (+),score=33.13 GFYU01067335.1:29-796(+)
MALKEMNKVPGEASNLVKALGFIEEDNIYIPDNTKNKHTINASPQFYQDLRRIRADFESFATLSVGPRNHNVIAVDDKKKMSRLKNRNMTHRVSRTPYDLVMVDPELIKGIYSAPIPRLFNKSKPSSLRWPQESFWRAFGEHLLFHGIGGVTISRFTFDTRKQKSPTKPPTRQPRIPTRAPTPQGTSGVRRRGSSSPEGTSSTSEEYSSTSPLVATTSSVLTRREMKGKRKLVMGEDSDATSQTSVDKRARFRHR